MTTQFGIYSKYYDLLYQDKDYEGETDYLHKLLAEFSPGRRNVLELGCGTGRHAQLLAESGLHVIGVEVSPAMLEQAMTRADSVSDRRIGGSFTAVAGDARSVRFSRQFDVVVSLFHVVSYQTSNADVKQVFETAALHLEHGGCFIFDVWYGPAVLTMTPAVRIKRMESDEICVVRIAEPTVSINSNQVAVDYLVLITNKLSGAVEQISEQHHMRYYFAPELELLAEMHGLRVIHSEEWMTAAMPSERTWGVTFVAQKI